MLLRFFASFLFLGGLSAFANAQTQPELPAPLGAAWTMPLEQARRLPGLERAPNGALKASSTIRSNSQIELVARWQGRSVSLFFAQGFGLYAVGVEMTPWAVQHFQTATDAEQQDLEHCAPVRLAILQKYETPIGLAESWDTTEILPLAKARTGTPTFTETAAIDWPYARNWLIWEGPETRLALGEQFVWYLSKAGLAQRNKVRQAFEKEQQQAQGREREQHTRRQRQLNQVREAVLGRARELEPLF